MRRTSIAAGIILLLVGFAAGYRLNRRDGSHDSSAHRPAVVGEPSASAPSRALPESKSTAEHDERSARSTGYVSRVTVEPPATTTAPTLATPVAAAVTAPVAPPLAEQVPAAQSPVEPHRDERAAPPSVAPVTPPPSTQSPVESVTPTDDPESDRRAPVLVSLRFDPPEIQDGAVAVLSIGASDDLSGVNVVVGQVRGPTADAVAPFIAHDPGGTGVFTASISIPRHAQTGDWFVGLIQLVDKANNAFNANYTRATVPPGGALRVSSAESDSTPPTVERVYLEKPSVGGGEKNQVIVEVTDDRSGVASVYGWFESASRSARNPFSGVERGDGSWVGDLLLPADVDCGEWNLWQLRVIDKAQNFAMIPNDSPKLGHVSFIVAGGGGCDSEAPVLDNIFVSPTTVSNNSIAEVTLTISAHDQGSGLTSLQGRIEGPTPEGGQISRLFFRAQADPNNPDAPIPVKIAVPQHAARGVWHVALLILTDKANNARSYQGRDPDLANAYFNVE